MTDKELKTQLKNVYPLTPSEREKRFLRKYEKRSMQLLPVLAHEARYMGGLVCLAGLFLLLLFFLIARLESTSPMWYTAGALPVASLLLLSGLGRSERYGMQELEGASRFSLRFIRAVRLFLPGVITPALLAAVTLILRARQMPLGFSVVEILGFIGTPYMLNAFGSLLILRKSRGRKASFGLLAMTLFSCLIPLVLERAVTCFAFVPGFAVTLLLLHSALTVRESFLYITESEVLSWN